MLRIELQSATSHVMPGQTLSGQAHWALDFAPKTMRLLLMWQTSGRGQSDTECVQEVAFSNPQAQDSRSFSLDIPREPVSFSGTLITLNWTLELVADKGAHTTQEPLVVSHTGAPIQLTEATLIDLDDN